jgi:hypothetical protein
MIITITIPIIAYRPTLDLGGAPEVADALTAIILFYYVLYNKIKIVNHINLDTIDVRIGNHLALSLE